MTVSAVPAGAGAQSPPEPPGDGYSARDQARVRAVIRPTRDFSRAEAYELRPGGAATVFKIVNRNILSHPSANLSLDGQLNFQVGDGIFRKIWVSAPASTKSSDGLGPLFNARSCQACHLKDGRAHPPAPGEPAIGLFLRLSIPRAAAGPALRAAMARRPVIPEPTYGGQLQTFAVQGHRAEGRLVVTYKEVPVRLGDGTIVHLRKPTYRVAGLAYGALHPKTLISPRLAPPMTGVGLLAAIPEWQILANADPEDLDGDGISGRPNQVWSLVYRRRMLGRFGWKAGQPTLREQAAAAFAGDIGISTRLYPAPAGECTARQSRCRQAPHGGGPGAAPEAPDKLFDLVVFYSRNLAVPARREPGNPKVLKGKALFYASGCAGCHRPKFVTRRSTDHPAQSFQLIWPYTDLLLHDMGPGLADGRPEGTASGREWRTPPLWGIGLAKTVNPRAGFLHDGRARTILEAILWHGGEARKARDRVAAMTRAEREALLRFLKSL